MSKTNNSMPTLEADSDDEDNIVSCNNDVTNKESTGMLIEGIRIVKDKMFSHNEKEEIQEVNTIPCLLHFKVRKLSLVLDNTNHVVTDLNK